MNGNFKDTRLIEAFDHIDPKYIAEVGESLKLRSVYTKEGEQPKNKLHINVKQITALAACVLLLALAMPMFTRLPEIINSFAAGWGEGTEEVPYLQFSPELEPISQELVDEINEKFFAHYHGYSYTLEDYYRDKGDQAEDMFNINWRVIRNYDAGSPYYGTIGNYVIFYAFAFPDIGPMGISIAGYEFEYHTYVYCIETKTICYLKDAYEQGLLNYADIKLLSKRRQEFYDFAKANKDIPSRITKEEYDEYKNKGE